MLLTSNGVLDHGPVQTRFRELVGRPLAECRTIVLLDAMLPFSGDKSKMLDHVTRYQALGWEQMDVATLLSGPRSLVEQRLRAADVILAYGGSNHWLAHAWRQSGLVPVLRELLDEKVYVGMSAGSMIFSRLHQAAVEALDDQEEVKMLQLDAVAPAVPLLDWFLVPHLGAEFLPHSTDEWAAKIAPRFGGPVWFLDDCSALLVTDQNAKPQVVSSTHWLHFDGTGALAASS